METVIVVRGSSREIFYNNQGEIIDSYQLNANGCPILQIPKGQWHGLAEIESGTIIFEAKDGAYTTISSEDILTLE